MGSETRFFSTAHSSPFCMFLHSSLDQDTLRLSGTRQKEKKWHLYRKLFMPDDSRLQRDYTTGAVQDEDA